MKKGILSLMSERARVTLLGFVGLALFAASEISFAKAPLKVITTFTIIQDIAQNVGGDAVIVESITKPGAEIHDYQPTPKDIVKAQDAELILWNGLNLERWFERFFQSIRNVPSVVVTNGITPLSIYEGEYEGLPNPHAWMSPQNALIYIDNIRQAFITHDPDNAEIYNNNAARYADEIRALDAPLREKLAQIPDEKRWLVTSEGAFGYLAADYGFKEAYLWPINADEEGSPQQVKRLIDTIRQHQLPVIFSESTISDKSAKQVAKETGAKYGGVLYVDSLSEANGPVPTYIKLLETTVQTIVEGFESP